jgi:hypothetical protein
VSEQLSPTEARVHITPSLPGKRFSLLRGQPPAAPYLEAAPLFDDICHCPHAGHEIHIEHASAVENLGSMHGIGGALPESLCDPASKLARYVSFVGKEQDVARQEPWEVGGMPVPSTASPCPDANRQV